MNSLIDDYLDKHFSLTDCEINNLLVSNENLFAFCKMHYCSMQDNDKVYLMKTSQLRDYAEIKAYYIYQYYSKKGFEPEMIYGGVNSGESFVKIKGLRVEFNGHHFINDQQEAYYDPYNREIETAENMILHLDDVYNLG
jgi:hypothetical protein